MNRDFSTDTPVFDSHVHPLESEGMSTDQLIDSFAAMLKGRGVPIRAEDNALRLRVFEEKLPKRMPQSFESFLTKYSFHHLTCSASPYLGGILTQTNTSWKHQRPSIACLNC